MSQAPDYDAVVDRLLALFRRDSRTKFYADGIKTHISDEWESPTADQCPALYVYPSSIPREALQLVGGPNIGQPYYGKVGFTLLCWAFSANGTRDSYRQCWKLVTATESVTRDDPTLGGSILFGDVRHVELSYLERPSDQGGGLFARGALTYEAQLFF